MTTHTCNHWSCCSFRSLAPLLFRVMSQFLPSASVMYVSAKNSIRNVVRRQTLHIKMQCRHVAQKKGSNDTCGYKLASLISRCMKITISMNVLKDETHKRTVMICGKLLSQTISANYNKTQ